MHTGAVYAVRWAGTRSLTMATITPIAHTHTQKKTFITCAQTADTGNTMQVLECRGRLTLAHAQTLQC
jgi:hypothetical protein